MTFFMILVSGLRHEAVGSDTINFLNNFDAAANMRFSEIWENFVEMYLNPNSDVGKDPALNIYNIVLGFLFKSHVLYLTVSASMLLIPLAIFMKNNVKSMEEILFAYLFFLSIYYVYMPNSALRQSIALGILLIGYNSLLKNNKLIYFIFVLLVASFFHKSALIAILLLIPKYYNKPNVIYCSGLLLFVIMLFEYEIVGVALSSQSEIYSMYSEGFYQGIRKEKPFVVLVLFAGIYLIGLMQQKKYVLLYSKQAITNYALSGTVFTIVFVPLVLLDPSLIRVTAYFIVWLMIYIPEAIKLYGKGTSRLLFIAFAIVFLYKAWKSGGDYAFFWQTMQIAE